MSGDSLGNIRSTPFTAGVKVSNNNINNYDDAADVNNTLIVIK